MNRRKLLNSSRCRTAVGLTLLAVVMGINFSSKSFSAEWRTIRKEELPITFYGPGLRNSNTRFSTTGNLYLASWVSKSSSVPRAEFLYQTARLGYSFTLETDLKDKAATWNWIKKKSPTLSETDTIWNGYGKTTYLTFSVDGKSCIALQRYMGQTKLHDGAPRLGIKYLTGYYCGASTQRIDNSRAEELISAISAEDERDASAPDGYWSEPTENKDTKTSTNSETTPTESDMGAGKMLDWTICNKAITPASFGSPSWDIEGAYREIIEEAKRRNFSPEQCAKLLGRETLTTPSKAVAKNIEEKLLLLKSLLDRGLINKQDYEKKKSELLSKF
jgi:hypothetical protein